MMENRDEILKLDPSALFLRCETNFTKGSGPGGQHRNKCATAVQLRLNGTAYTASDCTERSQLRNRNAALRKLKLSIALGERLTPALPPERIECSPDHPDYPVWAAHLLDLLFESGGDHRPAAEKWGISPSAMVKKIARDPQLWQTVQKLRELHQLPPLNKP